MSFSVYTTIQPTVAQLRVGDQLFLMLQDAVVLLDLDGQILDVNPAAEQIFGFPRQEQVGRRAVLFQEPSSEVSLEMAIRAVRSTPGDRWVGEILFRRKDGTTWVSETVVMLVRDAGGTPSGIISVHRDISERRLKEKMLEDQESWYHMLFDANPIPTGVCDLQTLRFLDVNTAAVEQYGYTRSEFLNMTLGAIRATESFSALHAMLDEDRQQPSVRRQVVHRKKDGTWFDVEVIGSNVHYMGRAARLMSAYRITQSPLLSQTVGGSACDPVARVDILVAAPAAAHYTLLVVDDNDAVRDSLSRMLRKAGYTVVTAPDGQMALNIWHANEGQFDALLCDAVMPGMRGVDLIRRLRQLRPELPVLLVSGYIGERLHEIEMPGRDIPVLEKPFTASVLLDRVSRLVKTSAA